MNRPAGRLWKLNANGYILNDAHPDLIRLPFTALVDALVQSCVAHISGDMDSIYITGSVARGLAVEGESDLNAFVVLDANADPDLVLRDWVEPAEAALWAAHPCVSDVRLELLPYYSVFTDPALFSIGAFVLKTHSACVWGVDLSSQLPDYKISPAIANDDLVQIADDLADAADAIQTDAAAENVRGWCQFAAKALLRSGFGLVQMAENVHTRDVDLCCASLLKHYPVQADDLYLALRYAHRPTGQADAALDFLNRLRGWLLPLADAWLDQHNPNRDLDLPVDDVEALE